MTREEAIEFAKEQLEIFGKDSTMYEFLEFTIKALEQVDDKQEIIIPEGYTPWRLGVENND